MGGNSGGARAAAGVGGGTVTGGDAYEVAQTAEALSATAAERFALEAYTGDAYRDINAQLRGTGEALEGYRATLVNESIRDLSALLNRSSIPRNMTVYRGFAAPASVIDKLRPGASFVEKSFSSTTSKQSVANFFSEHNLSGKNTSRVVMNMDVSRGSRGISVKGVSTMGEKEVLLAPGARFTVTRVQRDAKTGVLNVFGKVETPK